MHVLLFVAFSCFTHLGIYGQAPTTSPTEEPQCATDPFETFEASIAYIHDGDGFMYVSNEHVNNFFLPALESTDNFNNSRFTRVLFSAYTLFI